MLRQLDSLGFDIVFQTLGGVRVIVRDVIDNRQKIGTSRLPPLKNEHDVFCRSELELHP